jgi:hypothetical protein
MTMQVPSEVVLDVLLLRKQGPRSEHGLPVGCAITSCIQANEISVFLLSAVDKLTVLSSVRQPLKCSLATSLIMCVESASNK